MKLKPLVATALVAAVSMTASAPAFAQAAASAAAPPASAGAQVTHAAAPPGLCVLSLEGAIATSTVGKYVDTRMQQIISQVNAELNAEKTAIDNEAKTLDGQRATLDQNTFEQKGSALQVRANAFERKRQQRAREMQETQNKALGRFEQEMAPAITQVYQQKQCSLLLERAAVVLANPAMDVTPQVIAALNARIQTFTFDRERLDAPAAAAGK